MLAVLPLGFFGLNVLLFSATNGWRAAFIKAAVVWGLLVVGSAEALSPFRALSPSALVGVWGAALVVAGLGAWWRRALVAEQLRSTLARRPDPMLAAAVIPVAGIAVATGVIAWVAPPNTYDSMAYHMARVAHWAADGTVADYPTNVLRQLYLPPWSEFAVLHLQILSGGDHLANLVQWFSMIGSVVGASLIARHLGAPAIGQALAAIVVATLPMGILQASSTQTDYVLAYWLVCSVALALQFVKTPTPQAAAWFASGLGLAMLTKGTAYVFAAPLVAALGYWMLSRLRKQLLLSAAVMVLIPLVINSGYYLRNQTLFHNPVGPVAENALVVNASFSPPAIVSNLMRDGILQFGTPITRVNQWVEHGIARVHAQVLHIGVSDPATTYPDAVFHVNALSLDEDYAGDPLQALLAIAAVLVIFVLAFRRVAATRSQLIYAGGLAVAFLLFAAYLRWQPWNSRLELPLLVLAGPLIAVVLARRANVVLVSVVGLALCVAAVPWVIDNQTRPLVGFAFPAQPRYLADGATIFNTSRTELYFVKGRKGPFIEAAAAANQIDCQEIGFWSGPADWEYPLWVLASRSRVDAVLVNNESKHAAGFASKPCMLVDVTADQPPNLVIDGVQFTRSAILDGMSLYAPSQGQ